MGANAVTTTYDFVANQVLTAAQMDNVNCGIPVFATTTTRDAAFGGVGEKVLAQGQYAYIEATSTLQVYSGAAWVAVGGGLSLVKTQTIGSAVAAVTVSDAFSATYDNYLITVNGGVASGDINLGLTLGSAATGYYSSRLYILYSSATVTGDVLSNASNYGTVVRGSTNNLNGSFNLYDPFNTKNTHMTCQMSGSSTGSFWQQGGGYLANTTSFTAFTLTCGTGTVTGGTIRVYGYQNS